MDSFVFLYLLISCVRFVISTFWTNLTVGVWKKKNLIIVISLNQIHSYVCCNQITIDFLMTIPN